MRRSQVSLGIASAMAVFLLHCDDWHAWDDVFDRRPSSGTSAWTGGDGAVSVPLPNSKALWIFGDSLVSGYDAGTGLRTNLGITFGNTIGYQSNIGSPDPSQIDFYARLNGAATAITSNANGSYTQFFDWTMLGLTPPASPLGFWPGASLCMNCTDGDSSNDRLLVSLLEVVLCDPSTDPACIPLCDPPDPGCTSGLKGDASVLAIVTNPNSSPTAWTIQQSPAPAKITTNVQWGAALMQDGSWTYIYGSEIGGAQNLFVARSTSANLMSPLSWQYWVPNGSGGIFQTFGSPPSANQLKAAATGIGSVPSVSKITRRNITRYVLVHDHPVGDHFVYVRSSTSPTSWAPIDAKTPKGDIAAMDTSLQWVQVLRYMQGTCSPWVHNGESDFRACGTSYHGTAHPEISYTDSFGISSLVFSYIIPNGPDGTVGDQKYYRPKFGAVPMDNLPDWCAAAGQPCWNGIGRLYNTRSVAANADATIAFDVSLAAGLGSSFPLKATITGGTGNPDLYVKWGSQPPTLTSYDCRSNSSGVTEDCTLAVPAGKTTAQVMVHGTTASTYALEVSYVGN